MQPWGLDGWRIAFFIVSGVGVLVAVGVGLFAVEPRPRPPLVAAAQRGQSVAGTLAEWVAAAQKALVASRTGLGHMLSLKSFQILIAQVCTRC